MVFNLQAAKAYIGALIGASTFPTGVSNFFIGLIEKGVGIDLPASVEGIIYYGVAAAVGYIAVYFVPNAKPTT